jgi:hypothetical protein
MLFLPKGIYDQYFWHRAHIMLYLAKGIHDQYLDIDHNSPLPQTTGCIPYATMLIIIPLCHKQHDVYPMPKILIIIPLCQKQHDVCPMPRYWSWIPFARYNMMCALWFVAKGNYDQHCSIGYTSCCLWQRRIMINILA